MADTVVKITIKEVYDKLLEIEHSNSEQHSEIIRHLEETNGRVKANRWIATTALTITLMVAGWCMVML